jgi:hypothetical protein
MISITWRRAHLLGRAPAGLCASRPSDTRTICTRPRDDVYRLLDRYEAHAQVQTPVELMQPDRVGVPQRGANITQRVDHRVDLGVGQRRAGRCVVNLGLSRRATGQRPVQRVDKRRRRVDFGCNRVLKSTYPGLGIQQPPLGHVAPTRLSLACLRSEQRAIVALMFVRSNSCPIQPFNASTTGSSRRLTVFG